MDPSNQFVGASLPPPPVWSEDEMKSPQLEANNQNSSEYQQKNNHSTPGGPTMDLSNPFYQEQRAAVQKYKQQQALEEQQEQYSQNQNQNQNQNHHQQQQQYNTYQQQQYAAQQQAYAAQQAMQQQYYRMQSMHNIMAQQQSMHNLNIMAQQQSKANLNINANAMNIMAQQGSFRQQMSPHMSPHMSPQMNPTNPFFNQQQQAYYNQQPKSPQTQALNAFKQSLDSNPLLDEKQEDVKSDTQLKEEKRKRNRIRAVDELISTEKTYVSKLGMLNSLYVTPMKENVKLLKKPNHHGILFPVVLQTILALNMKLLTSMEKNKNLIGKAIYDFIPYLKMYQNYMNNHEAATRLIKQYRTDKNCEFTKYLVAKELEQSGFTLQSYLILPIQRIPRYELMLKEIIKLTDDGHEDKENLIKCYDKVAAVNKQINLRLKDYETRQKVHDIEMRIINLEINKEKNVKKSSMNLFKRRNSSENMGNSNVERTRLVQPSRIFVKKGILSKVSRKKDIKYLFILFNDLLIYCSKIANDKLILHQKIDITDEFFRIETAVVLDDDIDYDNINEKDNKKENNKRKHTFEIHSIEKSFLCCAESAEEREDWIDAIMKCIDSIKKSGIEQKKNKIKEVNNNNLEVKNNKNNGTGADFGRFNSAPVSATGSSRFDAMMFSATAPNAIEAAEDEGRILETAPMWVPNDWSDECMIPNCNNKFSTFKLKKRNHCRYCGKLVCSECCTNTLPHYEPKKRKGGIHVKVCKICHDKYKVKPLMNVEQLHSISKNMNNKKQQQQENNNKHVHRASLQIEEEESKSMLSNDSDEWSGLYDNMQLINQNSNNIQLPQSHTPVSQPQPVIMNGNDISKGMHSATYSNNSMKNMSYVNNYNHNPMLQSSPRKSPRRGTNNTNNSNNMSFPNISPIHNMSGSYSNAFDAIDNAVDVNPLPDEKNIFDKKEKSVGDIKYSEDLGTVSAIIAANDNLINSMDMSQYNNNNNNNNKPQNKRVSLEFGDDKPIHKKVGNAVVLDENVEARDDSDSDEFAANFNNIVIPDSINKDIPRQNTNEELYGFMNSPNANKKKKSLLNENDVMKLDKENDNVKQLTMFGFTWPQIEDAWKMMKLNSQHKDIVPDHGPRFLETMLDYLNKVQKEKSKSKILSAYKNNSGDNNNGMFAGMHNNNNNNNNFGFQFN